jgi:uncharacterized protein (TIGR00369 family)
MPPPGFAEVEDISPFTGMIGPFFQRKEADGSTTRAFRVLDQHLNGAGITHGGMMMTFADTLLARAIRDHGGGPAVTVRMTTDFLGPSHIKDWVEGRAWVTRETNTMFFVEGEIMAGKHMIMRASGIFRKIRRRNA